MNGLFQVSKLEDAHNIDVPYRTCVYSPPSPQIFYKNLLTATPQKR